MKTYEKMLLMTQREKNFKIALRVESAIIVAAAVLSFTGLLARLVLTERYRAAILSAVIAAVPFLLVTLLRRLINAPRPYEVFDFFEVPPKARKGCSFPSRHATSVFVIGTLLCGIFLPLGVTLLVAGVMLCLSRVLLGIHFPRDVIAGALIGAAGGVLGLLILAPFA